MVFVGTVKQDVIHKYRKIKQQIFILISQWLLKFIHKIRSYLVLLKKEKTKLASINMNVHESIWFRSTKKNNPN